MTELADRLNHLSAEKHALLRKLLLERTDGRAIPRREGGGPAPLSFAQQRLWFLHQLDPGSAAYHLSFPVRLRGVLSVPALRAALEEAVRRHEVLRTVFPAPEGVPVQQVLPGAAVRLPAVDLAALPPGARRAELERLAGADAARPFTLEEGPLLRSTLVRLAGEEHVLLFTVHHIVSDGWSTGVLVREVSVLYGAFSRAAPSPLLELPVQYGDYAAWQRERLRGERLERQLAWWRERLAGAPPLLGLPTDRPRPPSAAGGGGSRSFALSAEASAGLRALAGAEGATPFMMLLAGFLLLLARYSGEEDVVVGIPVSGRDRRELEGLVGLFVNTVAVRGDLSGDPTVRELLGRVRRAALGAYEHQDVPFERVVDELGVERTLAHAPVVQAMFSLEGGRDGAPARAGGIEMEWLDRPGGAARFDLSLKMADGERLEGTLTYRADLFEDATAERMIGHLGKLLEGMAAVPARRAWELPLLEPAERRRVLEEWNATARRRDARRSVHDAFSEQAARTPRAVAVVCGRESLTYAELERRAGRLAANLRVRGVGPETRVAICLERSAEMIVAVLGVLGAGGAYVPLDPASPRERLARMVAECGARLVVAHSPTRESLLGCGAEVVCLDAEREEGGPEPGDTPPSPVAPENAAYVIYTSGSTGAPRGVVVTHGSVLNLAAALGEAVYPAAGRALRVSVNGPLSFDTSVKQVVQLLRGHALCIVPEEARHDAEALGRFLREERVDVLDCTPAQLRSLLEEGLLQGPDSRPAEVLVAGEAIDGTLWARLASGGGERRFHNLYGPTECTVDATTSPVAPRTVPSIGSPLGNVRTYVLGRGMEPVPVGVSGELYIGGAGVARGYQGRPELTAERFVPDAFSGEPGGRLYRTGDRVRWLAGGTLEFLGRVDHQVKVRGFRVEPGEVEAALRGHPGVAQAVVVAREDVPGQRRLVGYVVAVEDVAGGGVTPGALREWLRERLPEHLVPSAFVLLEALPLTPNGKLDRRALPAPERGEGGRVAPRTEAERALAQVWAEVLRVERVGVEENFFELGGDSILSIQVVSRARRRGLHLSPRQLFEHPTVAALARVAGSGGVVEAEQGIVTGAVELTPVQRWFFERELAQGHHWNQSVLLRVRRALEPAVLERALGEVLGHHDALRMRFRRTDQGWVQENAGVESRVPLTTVELCAVAEGDRRAALERAATQAQGSLRLERGPVRAVRFAGEGGRGERLLLVVHHLVVDAVSWRVLLEDLEAACAALERGAAPSLPAKTTSFRAWAARLGEVAGSAGLLEELPYWREVLAGGSVALPVDHPGGGNRVGSTAAVAVSLTAEETRGLLKEVPGAYRTQVNDALLAALARALCAWTGGGAVRVELEGHGREEEVGGVDVSRTVGWFTTLYPVRLEAHPGEGVEETLKRVKEELRAVPRRGLGYGLLRHLGPEEARRELGEGAPPEVGFNYLGQVDGSVSAPAGLFALAGESAGDQRARSGERGHLLEVGAVVAGSRLSVSWKYSRELHRRETVERLAQGFARELRELVEHCRKEGAGGGTPSDFPLAGLDQAALARLLAGGGEHGEVEDVYPLTPMQEGILFHSLDEGAPGAYIGQSRFTLAGPLDVEAFRRAWRGVLDRHSALRADFAWEGLERPLQVVRRGVEPPLLVQDRRGLPEPERREQREAFLREDRARGFDLARAPLMRLALFRTGEEEWELVWTHHHLVQDGWSLGVIFRDVVGLYGAYRRGERPAAGEGRPFRDYVAWLERRDRAAAERFWRAELAGLASPTRLARGRTTGESGYGLRERRLAEGSVARMQEAARAAGLTLNTLVQGAWALLLSRYGAGDDVVFGAVVSGRPAELEGVEEMVGLFINALPVRVRIPPRDPLLPWLRVLQDRQARLREMEHTPLVQAQRWAGLPGSEPLFDTLLIFENYPVGAAAGGGGASGLRVAGGGTLEQTSYPLTVAFKPAAGLLVAGHERSSFDAPFVDRLLGHLEGLLERMAAGPERPLADFAMLAAAEREQLVVRWNDTARALPSTPVHVLFERSAARYPHAPAIVSGGRTLTYAHLEARSASLARRLRARGVGPDARVGVLLERSPELIIAILGVLRAGGAYVPLDPSYPPERLRYMLADSAARLLLTDEARPVGPPHPGVDALLLEGEDEESSPGAGAEIAPDPDPESLAYVIYTSGSTGRPKGVMVPHRGLSNVIGVSLEAAAIRPGDRVLQAASASFDASVLEVFLALAGGGTLHLVERAALLSPAELAGRLLRERINVVVTPPSLLATLPPGDFPELRTLIVGGERCPAETAGRWARGRQMLNAYAPTEATIYATLHTCAPLPAAPPLGRPIANLRAYVLDGRMEPVPVGVPGEVYLGGAGVVRGYQGRPGLTAERFIPDPFAPAPGARMYRSGDVAQYLPDGALEFLGRIDDQVKIRGFRVEPGEIETVLRQHPRVRDAAVVLREDGRGDPLLAGYLVPADALRDDPGEVDLAGVRAHLRARLPEYMVPGVLLVLEALPRTPTGKLDRRSLPDPDAAVREPEPSAAPRTPVEEVLAAIWGEVLRRESIGREESFFDLGGHSLLAARVISRIRSDLAVEVPIRALFEEPTVARLAAEVESLLRGGSRSTAPALGRRGGGSEIPLSFAQHRLWVLDRLNPGTAAYNLPVALRVRGALDRRVLERSVNVLARRHEALRTVFPSAGGEGAQRVLERLDLRIPEVDLGRLPDREAEAMRLAQAEARRPFDLARGPLLRAAVVRLGPDDSLLLFTLHHIVSDGWSMGVLVREVSVLHEAFSRGEEPRLPELPVQYADYALWQRAWLSGEILEAQLAWWRERLAGAPPVLELPTDRSRPPVLGTRGGTAAFALSPQAGAALRSLSRREGATHFMTTLAAFQVLLSKYAGQEDFVVGTPVAGRARAELEGLIGFFVNTLPLRTRLEGDPPFRALLGRVREEALGAYMHQDLPFERLVEELGVERSLARTPLFQVMFSYEESRGRDVLRLGTAAVERVATTHSAAKFDLSLGMSGDGERMVGTVTYRVELWDQGTMERLLGHLRTLLEGIAEAPEQPVSELPLLEEGERRQLLRGWSAAGASARREPAVHERFAAQAARTPGAVALRWAGGARTYAELEAGSNRVAHALLRRGVGPEVAVAVCAERTPALLEALLGVWKAGGVFVPLEPEHPAERRAYVLRDAGARLVVGHAHLLEELEAEETLALDDGAESLVGESTEAPGVAVAPESLAYIIYTSGTTGRPKGVGVSHGSLAGTLGWCAEEFGFGAEDEMPSMASSGFDIWLLETALPWLGGGRTRLLERSRVREVKELVEELEEVTALHAVPALMGEVVEEIARGPGTLPRMRWVLVGGDVIPPELPGRMRAVFPGAELRLGYGPTEGTIISASVRAEGAVGGGKRLMGRPHGSGRMYVLDGGMEPVAEGVAGEVYVGGGAEARGYVGRAALTAERFVPDPFGADAGGRLYRTGDRARWGSGGVLEHLGRVDGQVKLRGYRIEPGEVEAVLREHAGVREAAVVLREDRPGDPRLVAYVVPRAGAGEPPGSRRDDAIELWPSIGAHYVYDELIYHGLSSDVRRNDMYRIALERHVSGRVVVDVGTGGDAVLARLCAEAGARKVYAVDLLEASCDQARRRVEALGLGGTITVVQGDARTVELPEPADVCVSEIVDSIGGAEGAATILRDARRLLRDGGVFVPARSVTRIAAASLPAGLHERPAFTEVAAHYVERIFAQVGRRFDLRLGIRNFPSDAVLSGEGAFEDLDFQAGAAAEFERRVALTVERAGRFDGFVLWLELHFGAGEVLDTLRERTSWVPVFLPVLHPGVQVVPGDRVEVVCSARLPDGGVHPDYRVRGSLVRGTGERLSFDHLSPARGTAYRAGPFYDRLFAGDGVPVTGVPPAVAPAELYDHLRERLPEYMVPGAVVLLDSLPLGPNDKLDRAALPEPGAREEGRGGFRTPAEEVLAGLWEEVLGRGGIGPDDGFFTLGGHSLTGTRLVSRIREVFGIEVPLRALFEAPTVAGLARAVERLLREGGGPPPPPLVRVPRDRPLPLSFAQQRLWFLHRLDPASTAYHVPVALRLRGGLDAEVLARALGEVVRRHEALRTVFRASGGEPVQLIREPGPAVLPAVDLAALPGEAREAELLELARAEARRPFDLAEGPLLRGLVVRLGEEEDALLLTMHHVVSDGWSMGVLVREVSALYGAFSRGEPSPLPELPVQYADHAVWQRSYLSGEVLERELAYWREALEGAPPRLELPTDRARPAVAGGQARTVPFLLPAEVGRALRALARGEGATLFMALLAGWQALLGRYAGQEDFVVGTPIAGRTHAELEGLIGFFVNTLALRADLSGDPTVGVLLGRVRERTLGAYAHQELPFERLVEALGVERSLAQTPLFQVMLVLQNLERAPLRLGGVRVEPLGPAEGGAKFDLSLALTEQGEALAGTLTYRSALWEASTAGRMVEHLEALLRGMGAGPGRRLGEIGLLGAAEREQVLRRWNRTGRAYPAGATLHGLVEAQARRTPQAPALVYEGRRLEYGELQGRAERLAERLRGVGVGPEVRVGVSVERSPELVVALLGVLRAGGAYVPLDPSYPAERQEWMLRDAAVPVVLAQEAQRERLRGVLAEYGGGVLWLGDGGEEGGAEAGGGGAAAAGAQAENLAYVIYTSGSTGRPKGAMNEHRGIVNRLLWMQERYGLDGTDVVLQKTPTSFDVSVWELFWPLLSGARLVLARPEGHRDAAYLWERIESEGVTTVHFVPPMLQAFLEARGGRKGGTLRRVFSSGEALSAELAERFREALPGVELHNLYGPTEAAVDVTHHACAGGEGVVPIGRPVANTRIYVLDGAGEPSPVGVPGELCIGGVQVGRGYLGGAAGTAERYVPDAYGGEAGGRLYRTGDRGRWRESGEVEYLGRLDAQVKVRGYRIEPGEIEAALRAEAGVREAVVVVRGEGAGEGRLVGYVVGEGIEGGALREGVRARLPEHMVPTAVVVLEELPLTPNGKLDRRALPSPPSPSPSSAYAAPQTAIELQLVEIWEELLRVHPVGVTDNFFELGGNSLLGVRLVDRAGQRFGCEVQLAVLISGGTIRHMAEHVQERLRGTGHARPAVLPIQPSGSRPPLFCVHALSGEVLVYVSLAQHLGFDQPVYGLQDPWLDSAAPLRIPIEQMAERYVREMREVQPSGPYSLGGYSFGSTVAFEMARQLRAAGEEVGSLVILDMPAPHPVARPPAGAGPGRPGSPPEGAPVSIGEMWLFAVDKARYHGVELTVNRVEVEHLTYEEHLEEVLHRLKHHGLVNADAGPEAVLFPMRLRRVRVAMLRAYRPGPYDGPITVFRAEGAGRDGPTEMGYISENADSPTLGWAELTTGMVEVLLVPGDHLTMMSEPHIEVLARSWAKHLDEVRSVPDPGELRRTGI